MNTRSLFITRITRIAVVAFAALAFGALPGAAEWRVERDRSTFAVLTHRDGIGARLAHDHLIVARGGEIEFGFAADEPGQTRFRFAAPVLALDVDPGVERAALAQRLTLLGALTGELPAVAERDREKVRQAMLARRQLYAERFPTIRAELVALEQRGAGGDARVALGWNARVKLTIRGREVEKVFPARWQLRDGELTAEILGEARFTDFGIRPYSAVFGAIRNADLFHIYVELVARESG